jgi:hypothetical protein
MYARLRCYCYTEREIQTIVVLPTLCQRLKGDLLPKVKGAIQRRSTSLRTIAEVTAVAVKE